MWRSPATARCHQPQLTWVEVRRDALGRCGGHRHLEQRDDKRVVPSAERRARYSVPKRCVSRGYAYRCIQAAYRYQKWRATPSHEAIDRIPSPRLKHRSALPTGVAKRRNRQRTCAGRYIASSYTGRLHRPVSRSTWMFSAENMRPTCAVVWAARGWAESAAHRVQGRLRTTDFVGAHQQQRSSSAAAHAQQRCCACALTLLRKCAPAGAHFLAKQIEQIWCANAHLQVRR